MGRFQATEGIDIKGNASVTGSLATTGDIYSNGDIYSLGMDNTNQSNFVGYSTATGKLTYFSTGSYKMPSISVDAPSGATNVTFDVDIASSDANWTIQTIGSSDPTGAGLATVNNSNPASVTRVAFWKIANSSVNMTTPLTQLSTSSSIYLDRSAGNIGLYRIVGKTVSTNVVSYNLVYLSNAAGNFIVSGPMRIVTSVGVFERSLSPGYNYLNITNSGGQTDKVRLRYEAVTGGFPDGGGYIPFQIFNSGTEDFDVEYIVNLANYNFVEGNGFTGTVSGIDPNIKTLVSNLGPGERLIGSFMVWGEGLNEGIIPQHWTRITSNGTLLYGPQ